MYSYKYIPILIGFEFQFIYLFYSTELFHDVNVIRRNIRLGTWMSLYQGTNAINFQFTFVKVSAGVA